MAGVHKSALPFDKLRALKFEKIHGLGNDFILLEPDRRARGTGRSSGRVKFTPENIKQLCDRNFGVGADGVIVLKKKAKNRYQWTYYNSDGGWAEMCVNGIRCSALYVARRSKVEAVEFETPAGLKIVEVVKTNGDKGVFRVHMGRALGISRTQFLVKDSWDRTFYEFRVPFLGRNRVATFVSMGNPHCVMLLKESVFGIDPSHIRAFVLENTRLFPEGVNLELVNIAGKTVIQRTWERGAGETLACGSGACAVFWALNRRGSIGSTAEITLKGGKLRLFLDPSHEISLEGAAEYVYSGVL